MKPSSRVHRLLLVAGDSGFESDFLAALRDSLAARSSTAVFELVYCPLVHVADFLLVLDMLDRAKSGFFDAVYLAPQASTWSRLRNASTTGQVPLRSRSEPLGLCSLKPQEIEKVTQSNREWETALWILTQSASCRSKNVGVLLIFPEDFGGHQSSGPASPWSSREVLDVVRTCDVRRGSAFLCQLAGTDQRRPVGIITNLPEVKGKLFLHWPSLVRCGDELIYNGPLPGSCPCVPQHKPFRGTDAQANFVSTTAHSPGVSFWKMCLADILGGSLLPLRDGEVSQQAALSSVFGLFSFGSCVHSRTQLYNAWLHGSLSRTLLADVASSGQITAYLENSVPTNSLYTKRPNFSTACSITAVGLTLCSSTFSPSASLLGSPMAPPSATSASHRARDRRSRSPLHLPRSIARTPSRMKSPLVQSGPRGWTPNGSPAADGGVVLPGANDGVLRTRTLIM